MTKTTNFTLLIGINRKMTLENIVSNKIKNILMSLKIDKKIFSSSYNDIFFFMIMLL